MIFFSPLIPHESRNWSVLHGPIASCLLFHPLKCTFYESGWWQWHPRERRNTFVSPKRFQTGRVQLNLPPLPNMEMIVHALRSHRFSWEVVSQYFKNFCSANTGVCLNSMAALISFGMFKVKTEWRHVHQVYYIRSHSTHALSHPVLCCTQTQCPHVCSRRLLSSGREEEEEDAPLINFDEI